MSKRRQAGIAIALLLALALPLSAFAADTVEEVTRELMCQCGCTMIVNVCDCGTAEQMRQVVRDKLAEGKTGQQIVDYFVSQYGEKVLGSPKKEGFNLTAYVLPFAAIAVGGGGISAAAYAWARHSRTSALAPAEASGEEDLSRYADDLERDLAALDREEEDE